MKLLFDQNLSRRLVDLVADVVPDSVHVTSLGLDTATDREIWSFARDGGYVVASKDSDFRQLAFLYGPPPKGVWLRVGNSSTRAIVELLVANIDAMTRFDTAEDEALIVLLSLPNV